MDALTIGEAVAGGLLLFFLPGFTVARALFPEWRLTGPGGRRRALETATLAFVLSVVFTILLGELLLAGVPGGFAARWSDPLLETSLAGVAIVGLFAGLAQGAYSSSRPTAPAAGVATEEEGAWELTRELDRLRREERRLERALRPTPPDRSTAEGLQQQLTDLRGRATDLERRREEQYAE